MTKRFNASSAGLNSPGVSGIRFSLILAFVVVFCFFQFSPSADAATATVPFEVGVTGSSNAADWIASRSDEQHPAQDNGGSFDSTSDLDDNDGSSDDVAADTFTRHNQPILARHSPLAETLGVHHLSFSLSRSLGTVPVFLLSTQSLTCLHDRLRERAPPIPVSHRSQA